MSLSKSSAAGGRAGTCFICKSPEDDELLYGKFIGKWKIQVHYYCLLLTSNLVQNGESDDEGIFGFLQEDIKAEVARIRSQKCYVCKAPYANISCCAKKCFRTFHTVCGRQAGCLNHFVDTYQSWCDKHVEVEGDGGRHGEEESCGICYEEMGPWGRLESIRAPCCQNGWFHRRCVAQFAQSAGYFFKCPLCNNNTDQFKEAIQRRGVYIPEKDAAWELEPNAFGEQLERPSECDAEVCLCRYGRDYDTINGKWDLRLCETCGSTCRHDLCMAVPTKNYVCNFCRPIVGDEPPAAVLALAEESRRAEAARRRPSISSEASSSSSSTIRPQARSRPRQNRLRSTSSSSTTSSSSSTIVARKKSNRPLSPSDDSEPELNLPDLIAKLPINRSARDKLLHSRAVIRLQKLTPAQIQQLSQPTKPAPQNSSSQSSVEFDFNYRATMNKQKRRKSVADLHFLRQVIRSDTDAGLTSSAAEEVSGDNQADNRTPTSRKSMTKEGAGSFAKKFKLKIGAGSAGTRKRRIVSSSESDLEGGGPVQAKKACPSTAPLANSKSKSRISLFPPEDVDSENTCPNSPHKLTASITVTINITSSENQPDPTPPVAPLPVPATVVEPAKVEESKSSGNNSTVKKCQMTLNSFFKKSPDESTTGGSGSGSSGSGSAIPSSAERKKKHSGGGGGARKKLVELDRSQRNLLDFFNRC